MSDSQNNNQWIALKTAAERTGYSAGHLNYLCRLGTLRCQKIGRNWTVSEHSLVELFDLKRNGKISVFTRLRTYLNQSHPAFKVVLSTVLLVVALHLVDSARIEVTGAPQAAPGTVHEGQAFTVSPLRAISNLITTITQPKREPIGELPVLTIHTHADDNSGGNVLGGVEGIVIEALKTKSGDLTIDPAPGHRAVVESDLLVDGKLLGVVIDQKLLASGAVVTSKIADGAVSSAKILDGTISAVDIAADGVGTSEIATGGVAAAEIAANAVDDSEIVDSLIYTGALTLTPGSTSDVIVNSDADSNFQIASTVASDVTLNVFDLTVTASGTGATGTLNGLAITNAAAAGTTSPDSLIFATSLDTDETVTNGLLIEMNATGGTLTNAIQITKTAGTLTTGILLGANLTTGIDSGANIIANVGNAGTDFDTSGGLTLASTLSLTNNTITCTSCVETTDIATDTIAAVDIATGGVGSTEILDNDFLEVDLKAVNTAADEQCLTFESTIGDFEWQTCGSGGATAFDAIGDPAGNGAIAMAATVQTFDWTDFTANANFFSFNFDNNGGTAGTDQGVVIANVVSTATTGDLNTEALLLLDQADTTATGTTAVDDALLITNSGGSTLTDAIQIGTGTQAITTAINIVSTGVTTDISLQNGETISNDTDGTISLNPTTFTLSGTTTLTASSLTTITCSSCVETTDIAADTIAAVDIATGAVGTLELTDNEVASADILLDTIAAVDIAADGVGTSEIAADAVDDSELANTITYTGALTLTPGTTSDFTVNLDADTQVSAAATVATDVTFNLVDLAITGTAGADTGTLVGLAVRNLNEAGTTGTPDSLVFLTSLDANETVTNGLLIDMNATGGTLTNGINITETAGTLTTGILLGAGLTTGIDSGSNSIANIGDASTDITSTGMTLGVNLTLSGDASEGLDGGGLTATDCDTAATSKLLYDDTTNKFSCGTDQNSGGATAFDAIGDPAGNGAIAMGATVQTFDWTDFTANANFFSFNFDNNGGTAGTDRGVVIANAVSTATTGDLNTEALLLLDQADTTTTGTTAVDDALLITNSGGSTLTDAIQIGTGTQAITTAINIVSTGVTTDISLQNGETISNDTDGTVAIGGTTFSIASATALNCTDCIDGDDLSDAIALDASTSITQDAAEALTITNSGSGATIIDLTSTGDLEIRDAGVAFVTFTDTGLVSLAASTATRAPLRIAAGTAPTTPVEGDVWNDSTRKALIGFVDGINTKLSGTVYAATGSATVSNTTTETTIVGSGIGTQTLPADFLTVGKTVRVTVRGVFGTDALSSATLQIRVKLGSTVVLDTTARIPSASITDRRFEVSGIITARTTGTTGTVFGQGVTQLNTSGIAQEPWEMKNTAATTVNTTVTQAVDVTAQWGAGVAAADTITGTNVLIEVLN